MDSIFPSLMTRLKAEEKTPRTKAQMIEFLTKDGEAWAKWLEGLDDNFLGEVPNHAAGRRAADRERASICFSP